MTGGIIGWVGAATGVFCLVTIAVERYYAVVYPFENMEALSERKLKVRLFQFIINCNSTTCIRISITLYQKPKVNSRNHRALQTIQFYEAFRMTLKNGFLKCPLFILSVNR